LSIEEMHDRLSGNFKILLRSPFVVVFERDGIEVSLFKGGRMLMKNVKDEENALEVYEEVMGCLRAGHG